METTAWMFLEFYVYMIVDVHLNGNKWLKKICIGLVIVLQIWIDGIEEGWIGME